MSEFLNNMKGCGPGEESLIRETYGFLIIIFWFLLSLAWVAYKIAQKHKLDVLHHIQVLSSRSLDSAMSILQAKQRKRALNRLRPKLFRIQQRLEAYFHDKHDDDAHHQKKIGAAESHGVWIHESGKTRYDAKKLFDLLDVNQDGFLSYDELQLVLELNPDQLAEFVSRMNQLDDDGKEDSKVSRDCFARYFLQVLEETTYFGPTPEEVQMLFVELAAGEPSILYTSLYDSQLSLFLSDPQINSLIALFKKSAATPERLRRKSRPSLIAQGATVEVDQDGSEMTRMDSGGAGGVRLFAIEDSKRYLQYENFMEHYASYLAQVTKAHDSHSSTALVGDASRGVDLAFQDLSLTVRVGGREIKVVNNVSGRLQAATMTALMGGSGAGKTSLLNALCGRAFYGTTTGTVRINGHVESIEDHKDATGFVPQSDDSVHAELTVKENLVYSGRFSLPKGTPLWEIEEYADHVMANLGLSRVSASIVGDVNRRGVSGGEKKRVNIGMELMAKPSILFLDEPTSGLDSSSALLVMGSLKNLVKSARMTICSVIHQPRKQIFDSFDSLLLLGVGGNMVYNGPVGDAQAYFENLANPYYLPSGESLADWLIDISSGRLPPSKISDSRTVVVEVDNENDSRLEGSIEKDTDRRQVLYDCWNTYYTSLSAEERSQYIAPDEYELPVSCQKPSFFRQLQTQIGRNFLIMWRNRTSKMIDTIMIVGAVALISAFEGVAELTRDWNPNLAFDHLVEGDPMKIPLTFPELFRYAIGGAQWTLEFSFKVAVITAVLLGLSAAKVLTSKRLEFFREAGSGWSEYFPKWTPIAFSILLGVFLINGTMLFDPDSNAYFLAVNITSTVEHVVQMFLAAGCAYWLRDSATSSWYTYQVQFIMLMWMVVSWSLFLPLLVPPNNVVLGVGFFIAFFGLLFCGALAPVMYKDIYESDGMAVFSGILSVTRYFIEGMTVQELRNLPEQSGFTVQPSSVMFPYDKVGTFALTGFAQNDLSVVQKSGNGWYWGVLPAFMAGLFVRVLGLGALHVSDRSRQNKKSLLFELRKDPLWSNGTFYYMVGYVVLTVALFALTVQTILATTGHTGIDPPPENSDGFVALSNQTLEATFGANNGTLPKNFTTLLAGSTLLYDSDAYIGE